MEFTYKEIELCKLIAEKERKEIKYGDYYSYGDDAGYLCDSLILKKALKKVSPIPLWTLSDAIEWLTKKPDLHTLEIIGDFINLGWNVILNWKSTENGKTPLEACLKAILAILNEEVG